MATKQIILIAIIVLMLAFAGINIAGRFFDHFVDQLGLAANALGYFMSCSVLVIGFIAWLRRREIHRWFHKNQFINTGSPFNLDQEQVIAAVIPVSNPTVPAWILCCLRPKSVALVYTAAMQKYALDLAADYSGAGFAFFPTAANIEAGEISLTNPDSPKESKELVKRLINHFLSEGIKPHNIFVDTTGGKVPISIGAFQAAEELNVSSIYITATMRSGKIENPRDCSQGHPVFMSDHTLK